MKLRREKYSDVFDPRLSEPELRELWRDIEKRTPARLQGLGRSRRMGVALSAAALAAGVALVLFFPKRPTPVVTGRTIEALLTAQTMELPDGSQVNLEPGAQVRVERFSPEDARLVLIRGAARFAVVHRASRSFIVAAGEINVAVIGTRFRVGLTGDQRAQPQVDVEVQQGVVEIRRLDGRAPASLEAGEHWTSAPHPEAIEPPVAAPTASSSAPPEVPPERSGRVSNTSPASSASEPRERGSVVFEAANEARIAGRAAEAASLFDRLRRNFRSDPRAALAALQLGRIRLDELGDPAGAIEALRDALSLGGGGSLRDDAQARLVEAYERSGMMDACRRARTTYLSEHPAGAHRAAVEQRCAK